MFLSAVRSLPSCPVEHARRLIEAAALAAAEPRVSRCHWRGGARRRLRRRRDPVSRRKMISLRRASLALMACTSTISPWCTRPRRIITSDDNRLSATRCAVPAFIRVEPAIGSGPVSSQIGQSASCRIGVSRLLAMPIVSAPRCLASRRQASVNGVVPLAATRDHDVRRSDAVLFDQLRRLIGTRPRRFRPSAAGHPCRRP